jgi:ribonuclease E
VADETQAVQAFVDTVPGAAADASTDAGTGEVREGARRRRRGRGGRDRDDTRQAGAPAELSAGIGAEAMGDTGFTAVPADDLDAAPISGNAMARADDGAPMAEGGEQREGGRRRRGRDRDRPRRERDDEVPTGVEAVSEAAAVEFPAAVEANGVQAPMASAAMALAEAPLAEQDSLAPRAAPARPAAPVEAPAAERVVAAAAHVEPFVLQTDQLQAVAESAGLHWVNSDAEKIRAAQEAMAKEPQPVRVPREPKPVVAIDEGPLVLVETRKDLTQFKLPFETQGAQQPHA